MEDGEAHTLGLLKELRELAQQASDSTADIAARFHELLRSVSSSNTPDVPKGLSFRVMSRDKAGEVQRVIAVCGNIEIARAAFETAKRIFPNDRWVLLWGAYVSDDTHPEK